LFGPGPSLIEKKNLPGRGLTKVEKHWDKTLLHALSVDKRKKFSVRERSKLEDGERKMRNLKYETLGIRNHSTGYASSTAAKHDRWPTTNTISHSVCARQPVPAGGTRM